ncbi:MAG: FAD-dependent oxidoreductase, partial [Spirochaetales bacterium]|nr:FAD-dependent oxidoreductase [Spirochaetales bacterium]
KLLIASGARPFIPPINGLDTVENKFTFMKLDDALALQEAIGKEKRVLVLGAGLIGLKCVEGIFDKVKEITVVDMADRILPSILDEKGAQLIKAFLEKSGVTFNLKTSIAELKKNEAILTDGRSVTFDILVIAVGVRPNIELAKEIGAEVRRGIVINSHCETNLKNIYAAGDCCECFDISADENRILALLPNAYMQGECAGMNMAGDTQKVFDKAIPMNAIGFFGYHIITAGSYNGESFIKDDGVHYKRLITKDNLLKGFILIGDVDRAGIYTSMIRDKVRLDSVDFELLKEAPQLMAFSQEERAKKLGGIK